MVRILGIAGVVGVIACGLGIAALRSDIQIIVALVGFFGAVLCFGLAVVLERLPKS